MLLLLVFKFIFFNSFQGLSNLKQLKELNLAENKIEKIGALFFGKFAFVSRQFYVCLSQKKTDYHIKQYVSVFRTPETFSYLFYRKNIQPPKTRSNIPMGRQLPDGD